MRGDPRVVPARCEAAREALSAALDGVSRAAAREDHLGGCAGCRAYEERLHRLRRLVRVAEAGPVPDVSERVAARLESRRGRDGRSDPWLTVAASFLAFAVLGAALVGLTRPAAVSAADVPAQVVAAQSSLDALTAALAVTEHGTIEGRRTWTGTLAYRAPESLAVRLEETGRTDDGAPLGADPGDGATARPGVRAPAPPRWAAVVLRPDIAWEASGRGRAVSGAAVTGREPFAEGAAFEAVLPVRSMVLAAVPEDLGRRRIDGHEAVGIAVSAAQLAPFLDAVRPGTGWRELHPTDRVELWVDAASLVPLDVQVEAGGGADRARWAVERGYAEGPGDPVLEVALRDVELDGTAGLEAFPDPPAELEVRDGGFTDADGVATPIPASLPDGMTAHRQGRRTLPAGQLVESRTYTDGRAWIRVSSVTGWPAGRLFGVTDARPVPLGTGVAYLGDGGRRVALHASPAASADGGEAAASTDAPAALGVVVTGSLAPEELLGVAGSLGVVGVAVSGDDQAPVDLAAARAALPSLLVPSGLAGFAAPTARLEGEAVVMVLAGAGDRAAVLTQLPSAVIGPPLEAGVRAVAVRGLRARWSPGRGELDWVESGAVRGLRSGTLGLADLLTIAETLQ